VAVEVVMPRLGWAMETGAVAEWLKKDGDLVREGDVIFTVESDKATQEVEALDGGILRIPAASAVPGTTVPVGTVLAYLLRPDEVNLPAASSPPGEVEMPVPAAAAQPTGAGQETRTAAALSGAADEQAGSANNRLSALVTSGSAGVSPVPGGRRGRARRPRSQDNLLQTLDGRAARSAGSPPPPASPRARRVAGELGVDWTAATATGRSGRIVERDVRALAEQPGVAARARVTPLARRLAEATGVDLEEVEVRLPGQRIARSDIEAAVSRAAENGSLAENRAPVEDTSPVENGAPIENVSREIADRAPDGRRSPLTRIRRLTADRMAHSARTVAAVTLTTEADATELALLRTRLKADLGDTARRVPSYNDLLTRLVALALREHPWMNASFADDGLIQHEAVHMGIAVDTERGLFVPVVRDADRKSIGQIAAETARLIERSRAGQARAEDLRGGTFTITNLGMYEIDAFTPIINVPECAILGVGRIVARPVVVDEETEAVAVRRMMALSLTFDHRAVDGAPAGRFLQHIKRWVEHPYAWLTD